MNTINCRMHRTIYCLLISFLFAGVSYAQPKPGKESINIVLPKEYRWKKNKIPKDTKSIRGTEYTIRGKNTENAPVTSIIITTIDKRYYPIKAASAPSDKLSYTRENCPDAELKILEQQTQDNLTSILYTIQSPTEDACGQTVFLGYAVEGPTAFHTIELDINSEVYSEELMQQWSDILLAAVIK